MSEPSHSHIDARSLGLYWDRLQQMIPTTFAYCSLVVVGALFESTGVSVGELPLVDMVLAALGLALVVCGQWFINDVYDKETDRHSNTDRPTTNGEISDTEAIWVGTILVVVGVVASGVVGLYALGSVLAFTVVNTAYTVPPLRTKNGGLSSMLTLGTMGGCSVLLGTAAAVARPTMLAAELSVIAAVFMMINLSYKDLKDADHDQRSGVENFAVKYGADTIRNVLMVLLPVSYITVALYFGLYQPLVVFAILGVYVSYELYVWDGDNAIVYKLDAVNGLFVIGLAVAYYLLH